MKQFQWINSRFIFPSFIHCIIKQYERFDKVSHHRIFWMHKVILSVSEQNLRFVVIAPSFLVSTYSSKFIELAIALSHFNILLLNLILVSLTFNILPSSRVKSAQMSIYLQIADSLSKYAKTSFLMWSTLWFYWRQISFKSHQLSASYGN